MLSRLKDIRGQGMVEYALILLLIALVVILSIPSVTNSIAEIFTQVSSGL